MSSIQDRARHRKLLRIYCEPPRELGGSYTVDLPRPLVRLWLAGQAMAGYNAKYGSGDEAAPLEHRAGNCLQDADALLAAWEESS